MRLLEYLLDLLFPPKCPFCRRVVDRPGPCGDCRDKLPWTAGPDTAGTIPGGTVCAAPLYYEAAVRDCLLRLKFSGDAPAAEPLGRLIAQCAAEELSGRFDVVTWVPVGGERLKKRGYDQARLLAEAACRCWDTKPERLLVKSTENPAQSGMADAAARRANVLGVYSLAPGAAAAQRRILLVDDIVTTGATLAECVRVLKEAGAADVVCAAAARTRRTEEAKKS